MSVLQSWLDAFPGARFAPLFETDDLQVRTHPRGKAGDRRILTHSSVFEAAMIELIEDGLTQATWTGLVYLMGVGEQQAFIPLYVGKAERRGKTHEVSKNIANIRRNPDKFARWGYGLDYHLGDLSHAMFGFEAYRKPTAKYRRWADVLFEVNDPPTLRRPVSLLLLPWYEDSHGPSGLRGSVASGEKEVIALASALHGDHLLNVDGR
ncbi:hypothetical protein [Deinococcus sp. QL22]|uniref:hypothetical protein n=1 Tax=Deinococcus sp. QL22 TaxID=2939437 RepID=UPI0020180293|nr:hypothetical protein [Deinococcus sp. QL22]UQN08816.1 hypothetical protein M1R55_19620 [Deinococcus sp. QL22]